MQKKSSIIFSQLNSDSNDDSHSHKLSLPHKPQISSIPGISPKEKNRYRVVLGTEILATGLTIDEALAAVGGEA